MSQSPLHMSLMVNPAPSLFWFNKCWHSKFKSIIFQMQNWLLSVFQGCCLKTMFVLRMVWYGLSDLHPFFPAFFQLLIWGEADGDKPATEPTEEDFEEGSAYFDQWCLHYCAPTQKEHIPDFKNVSVKTSVNVSFHFVWSKGTCSSPSCLNGITPTMLGQPKSKWSLRGTSSWPVKDFPEGYINWLDVALLWRYNRETR